MKDNFSIQAKTYAQFRPDYPQALFDFILQNVENKGIVWDCATGNGQAAKVLAQHFEKVYATDISQKQLDNAVQAENIVYTKQSAEQTDFAANTFDLITVAQAIHWFDFERFYAEARRVAKPNALLAVWGYGTLSLDEKHLNYLFWNFYKNVVGKYWDKERRHIDDHYQNMPFPFEKIAPPQSQLNRDVPYSMVFKWQRDEFEGYLNTWSSVQNCIKTEGFNPVPDFMLDVSAYWGEFERKILRFPIFIKVGKIKK